MWYFTVTLCLPVMPLLSFLWTCLEKHSGPRLFIHLKTKLRKDKWINLSKLIKLYFFKMWQGCHQTGFLSIVFRVWLYKDVRCLIIDSKAQTVIQYEKWDNIIEYIETELWKWVYLLLSCWQRPTQAHQFHTERRVLSPNHSTNYVTQLCTT